MGRKCNCIGRGRLTLKRYQIVDLLCLTILAGTLIYLLLFWGQIPTGSGAGIGGDGAASRQTLVVLLVVTWFLYAGLTMAEQLPRLLKGKREFKEEMLKLFHELFKMVRALKLALVILFSYLLVYSAGVHDLPRFLMPLILGITVAIIAMNLLRLNWMRNKD